MSNDNAGIRGVDAGVSTGSVLVRSSTVPEFPRGGDPQRRARLWRARQDELMVQRAARKLDELLSDMYGEVAG